MKLVPQENKHVDAKINGTKLNWAKPDLFIIPFHKQVATNCPGPEAAQQVRMMALPPPKLASVPTRFFHLSRGLQKVQAPREKFWFQILFLIFFSLSSSDV